MQRKPEDQRDEPPGGRAAERLREFIEERFPEGVPGKLPGGLPEPEAQGPPTEKKTPREDSAEEQHTSPA